MSAVVVITPLIIAGWPTITATVMAALGTMGYAVAKDTSSVAATLRFMHEVGVRRVPVLNSTGQLAGVMALDDALKALAEQLSDVAGCIRSEQRVERCVRA